MIPRLQRKKILIVIWSFFLEAGVKQMIFVTGALQILYVICCSIWYRLYNSKNANNTREGVLLLVNLQAESCNFTKSNTP